MTIHPPRYLLLDRRTTPRWKRVWALLSVNLRLRGIRLGPMLLVGFGLAATVVPLLVQVLLASLFRQSSSLALSDFYAAFDNPLLFYLVMLMTALVGSGIVADDLRSKSISLYLARPITVLDYLIGKGGVLVILLGILTVLPGWIASVLALVLGYASPQVAGEAALAFLAMGVLLTVLFAGLALLLSSVTTRKAFAGAGIFAIILVDQALSVGLAGVTGDLRWLYVSPWNDLLTVAQGLFGYTPLSGAIDPLSAFAVVFPLMVVIYLLTYLRLGRIEVVTD